MISKNEDHEWEANLSVLMFEVAGEDEPRAMFQERSSPPIPEKGSKISLGKGRHHTDEGQLSSEEEDFIVEDITYDYKMVTIEGAMDEDDEERQIDRLFSFVDIEIAPLDEGNPENVPES